MIRKRRRKQNSLASHGPTNRCEGIQIEFLHIHEYLSVITHEY